MTSPHTVRPEEVDTRFSEVIDVRAPVEFAEDHLPGALNLPVLTDAERVEVGRVYKQESPFAARRLGAGMITANISAILRGALCDRGPGFRPLVYCWRGGQRSLSLATILAAVGWPVSVLEGGYRAYRKFVREETERLTADGSRLRFHVIAGFTGSGKTRLLHRMRDRGLPVLDLEQLANHRGSLLGSDPREPQQPSQKAFENRVFQELRALARTGGRPQVVYVESESNRVGDLHIPSPLWSRIRTAEVTELVVPRPVRAASLLEGYDHFRHRREELLALLGRLRQTAGGANVDRWTAAVETGAWAAFVDDILQCHYDPAYSRSRERIYPAPARRVSLRSLDTASLDQAIDTVVQETAAAPPAPPPAGLPVPQG